MSLLQLYAIFHLNLAYSSIEKEQRPEVIHCCYWPLLTLTRQHNIPLGIEASAYTLEVIAALDSTSFDKLRHLVTHGQCEFIGSGYAQIISPLVPAEVNAANLRLGNQAYEQLLGFRPHIALVNEQAYSSGLVQHYIDADYRAIIMEWDNPYRFRPEWDAAWRCLPQIACGQHGDEIPLIWNNAIAFQKFQRYAHGEMELDEYLEYLCGHLSDKPRSFCLYGNDVEIFNFRPGRFETEAVLQEDEWQRIERLFKTLLADGRFQFICPSQVLELMQAPGAGNRLHLETPEQPVPVKKQGKYNITRWAVTGRDDVHINTSCWRIYEALKTRSVVIDDDWRELCYLWSSDFRTHITEKRWKVYRDRLAAFEKQVGASRIHASKKDSIGCTKRSNRLPHGVTVERNRRYYLTVETDAVRVRLNCRRGLTIDALWFKGVSDEPLMGTLPHGYYDDIALGADFYTGHLVLEAPGQPKVTDLNPVEPSVAASDDDAFVKISGDVPTMLGSVRKHLHICREKPQIVLIYELNWPEVPAGSLRLGHVTLIPDAFDRNSLFYRTHNGGMRPESFMLQEHSVDHGSAVSFLVSANCAVGMTQGILEIGDARRCLRLNIDKGLAALVGLVTYREVGDSYFCRVALSAAEMDETSRLLAGGNNNALRSVVLRLSAFSERDRVSG